VLAMTVRWGRLDDHRTVIAERHPPARVRRRPGAFREVLADWDGELTEYTAGLAAVRASSAVPALAGAGRVLAA